MRVAASTVKIRHQPRSIRRRCRVGTRCLLSSDSVAVFSISFIFFRLENFKPHLDVLPARNRVVLHEREKHQGSVANDRRQMSRLLLCLFAEYLCAAKQQDSPMIIIDVSAKGSRFYLRIILFYF